MFRSLIVVVFLDKIRFRLGCFGCSSCSVVPTVTDFGVFVYIHSPFVRYTFRIGIRCPISSPTIHKHSSSMFFNGSIRNGGRPSVPVLADFDLSESSFRTVDNRNAPFFWLKLCSLQFRLLYAQDFRTFARFGRLVRIDIQGLLHTHYICRWHN